ncbi:MAG: hypothetical protein WD830_09080 [Chloroflexota bacterium]
MVEIVLVLVILAHVTSLFLAGHLWRTDKLSDETLGLVAVSTAPVVVGASALIYGWSTDLVLLTAAISLIPAWIGYRVTLPFIRDIREVRRTRPLTWPDLTEGAGTRMRRPLGVLLGVVFALPGILLSVVLGLIYLQSR